MLDNRESQLRQLMSIVGKEMITLDSDKEFCFSDGDNAECFLKSVFYSYDTGQIGFSVVDRKTGLLILPSVPIADYFSCRELERLNGVLQTYAERAVYRAKNLMAIMDFVRRSPDGVCSLQEEEFSRKTFVHVGLSGADDVAGLYGDRMVNAPVVAVRYDAATGGGVVDLDVDGRKVEYLIGLISDKGVDCICRSLEKRFGQSLETGRRRGAGVKMSI